MSNNLEITDRLIDEVQKAVETRVITINDRPFVTQQVFEAPLPPMPAALVVHSLSAVADYINQQLDYGEDNDAPFLVQIQSPTTVLVGNWLDMTQRRSFVLKSEAIVGSFAFGQYRNVEDFIVAMQSQFAETEHLPLIIKLVSSLTDESVVSFKDDGVTQQVSGRVGIARESSVTIPRIVTLRPYRTFRDVVRQPDGQFLLRVKRDEGKPPQATLFEADGGLWQNDAIAFIKSYLEEQIDDGKAIIIG